MTSRLDSFIRNLSFDDLPIEVQRQGRRCVLDLLGTAAAGIATPLSSIIRTHAAVHFSSQNLTSRMLFDGRPASPVGAAMAGGMVIDSFDAHDGHVLTKGHAGAALLPSLLALMDCQRDEIDGAEFLTTLVVGYEIAIRAGIATHRTAPDYHTSGSWNALGVVSLAARLLDLEGERLAHAFGIAEYHGPRSPMMRCIDSPTMVKDGSGWGAMTGLSAAFLARDGFTGAPALVVEKDGVADLWSDLGSRWRIMEMYFKPYPVCRWAQPAVRAALEIREHCPFDVDAVHSIEIHTFHEATRLSHPAPTDTEQAQYSLTFPVAAALVHGRLDPSDISGAALTDPTVLDVARRIRLIDDPKLSSQFPAERYARAIVHTVDGREFRTDDLPAFGDAERPLTDGQITNKFMANSQTSMSAEKAAYLMELVEGLDRGQTARTLLDQVLAAPSNAAQAEGS